MQSYKKMYSKSIDIVEITRKIRPQSVGVFTHYTMNVLSL